MLEQLTKKILEDLGELEKVYVECMYPPDYGRSDEEMENVEKKIKDLISSALKEAYEAGRENQAEELLKRTENQCPWLTLSLKDLLKENETKKDKN